jgi:DnaK suppressor protein
MDQTRIDIGRIRQKLKLRRLQILEFLKRLDDEAHTLDPDSAQDVADRSVLGMSKESLFEQTSQQRIVLRMVDGALGRISDGSFGVCVSCGDDISARRLEALPWTQFCLRCQEVQEDEGRHGPGHASLLTTAIKREERTALLSERRSSETHAVRRRQVQSNNS